MMNVRRCFSSDSPAPAASAWKGHPSWRPVSIILQGPLRCWPRCSVVMYIHTYARRQPQALAQVLFVFSESILRERRPTRSESPPRLSTWGLPLQRRCIFRRLSFSISFPSRPVELTHRPIRSSCPLAGQPNFGFGTCASTVGGGSHHEKSNASRPLLQPVFCRLLSDPAVRICTPGGRNAKGAETSSKRYLQSRHLPPVACWA